MGGKKGVESGKEKAANKAASNNAKAAKDQEDNAWAAAGEGDKGKAGKKKEDDEKRKQEAAAKKLEAKKMAEEEEREMSKPKGGAGPNKTVGGVHKMTKYQLEQQKALEAEMKAKEIEDKRMAAEREVGVDQYAAMVETSNTNRADDVLVDARSLGDAIASLGIDAPEAPEKNPEKRMKAGWAGYEAKNMAALKEEKPGLKMQQYKDMLWKSWQKSPENPMVAAAAAAAGK